MDENQKQEIIKRSINISKTLDDYIKVGCLKTGLNYSSLALLMLNYAMAQAAIERFIDGEV